jgi:hypothetical protein
MVYPGRLLPELDNKNRAKFGFAEASKLNFGQEVTGRCPV